MLPLGDPRAMYNPQTGLMAMAEGVSGSQRANLRNRYGSQLSGISDNVLRMGELEIQDSSMANSRRQTQINVTQDRIGRQIQTGMAAAGGTLDARGRVVGGDIGMMSGAFNQFGVKFNRGSGLSQWEIEERQIDLRRTQQDFSQRQQGQSLAIDTQQFALGGRQFYENRALQTRQFEYSTQMQGNQFGIATGQNKARYGWQQEDFSFDRAQSQLGFGWQQEDFSREIRYARGRQKRDLIRQQGRSVVEFAMGQGQRDRVESRAGQEQNWTKEQMAREKEQFDQNTRFTREEMELQSRQFEEGRVFDAQKIQMQQESYQKNLVWMMEERALEDQGFLLSRQQQILQIEMANKYGEELAQMSIDAANYSVTLSIITREYERQAAIAQSMQAVTQINNADTPVVPNPDPDVSPKLPGVFSDQGGTLLPGEWRDKVVQLLEVLTTRESALNLSLDLRDKTSAKQAARLVM